MWRKRGTKALEAKDMTDAGAIVANINMVKAIGLRQRWLKNL